MATKIDEKLDKIVDKLEKTNIILAKQEVSLSEHIKRTNLLEEELKPVKAHVNMINGALKLIGICAALATIVEAIHMVFRG